jgi:hypothetical protein
MNLTPKERDQVEAEGIQSHRRRHRVHRVLGYLSRRGSGCVVTW